EQGLDHPPQGRARRHRLLRRAGHLGRRGLDAEQRGRALLLHRRHRPVRRAGRRWGARPGDAVRRRARAGGRLHAPAGGGGARRPRLRRVPHPQWRSRLLQHDAARPGGDRDAAGARDARRRRRHLGRRLDVQGQRHRALLPVRAARQPGAAHLQALAGRGLRHRARWTPRDERLARRARAAVPRLPGEGLLHRRQHLGCDPRGQDARAARRLARDGRADHGRAVLGPLRGHRERGRHGAVRRRSSGGGQRHGVRRPGGPGPRGQRRRRPPRPRHVGPDREPDHRGEVPWHLRGARHGAAVHRLRAAAQRDPQRGHDRQLPRGGPPPRPAAVRGPLARPAGPHAARVHPALGGVAGHRRGDGAAAPRRGLLDPAHRGLHLLVPPGEAVDGAHGERRVRPDRPDRPAHDAQPRHRRLARQARGVRRAAARPGPGARRERHAVRGDRGRRGRGHRGQPGRPGRPRDRARGGGDGVRHRL
ncbi:MAG: Argininosuccinate synthase, partial [uncultured Blastococcus sp.]